MVIVVSPCGVSFLWAPWPWCENFFFAHKKIALHRSSLYSISSYFLNCKKNFSYFPFFLCIVICILPAFHRVYMIQERISQTELFRLRRVTTLTSFLSCAARFPGCFFCIIGNAVSYNKVKKRMPHRFRQIQHPLLKILLILYSIFLLYYSAILPYDLFILSKYKIRRLLVIIISFYFLNRKLVCDFLSFSSFFK